MVEAPEAEVREEAAVQEAIAAQEAEAEAVQVQKVQTNHLEDATTEVIITEDAIILITQPMQVLESRAGSI